MRLYYTAIQRLRNRHRADMAEAVAIGSRGKNPKTTIDKLRGG